MTDHRKDGRSTIVQLAEGADDQVVLRAALATGAVREFSRRRPSLTDLFRDAVSTEPAAEPERRSA